MQQPKEAKSTTKKAVLNHPLRILIMNCQSIKNKKAEIHAVIWWAMRKLGIDEWLVRLVQSMYKDVRSRVRVGDGYSEEFVLEWVFIRALFLARCSLSLC